MVSKHCIRVPQMQIRDTLKPVLGNPSLLEEGDFMENQRRPTPKRIWFTEDEWHTIEVKMAEAGTTNFSAFGLEMLLHGEVRYYDFSNLKQLNASMGRIAGNINQIAKRCNENKLVHTNDVEQLHREFLELKADYLERTVKLLRKLY